MIEIRPWLLVGRLLEARDHDLLLREGVGAVLELAEPVQHPDIETLYVHVQDGYPLTAETIARGVDFVRAQRDAGHKILVACTAGISRSPTFAAVILKELEGLRLDDAFHLVHERHPRALPDQVIWDSLHAHYKEGTDFWDLWLQLMAL